MRGIPSNEHIRDSVCVFKRNLDYDGWIVSIIHILSIFRKRGMDKDRNLVTQIMRKRTALTSMTVGMFIMPVSALCMAYGNMLNPQSTILTMHPVAFMMVVGIVFQGIAETFISPRFLEYFSLQAPKGEEGLYLGFSHLHSFLSSIVGFGLSGYLLSKYCPEPTLFSTREEWLAASSHAHYIWYYFAGIALLSAIALIIYGQIVKRQDARKQIA